MGKQDMDPDDPRVLISPWDWARIVAIRPELLPYAPQRRFTDRDWQTIIAKQPQTLVLSKYVLAKFVICLALA